MHSIICIYMCVLYYDGELISSLRKLPTMVRKMSVEEAVRSCYVQQERHLQINPIIGSLFQRGIVSFQQLEEINATVSPRGKRLLLLAHLLQVDKQTLLTYCDVLEESATHDGLPVHRNIASAIRTKLDTLADNWGANTIPGHATDSGYTELLEENPIIMQEPEKIHHQTVIPGDRDYYWDSKGEYPSYHRNNIENSSVRGTQGSSTIINLETEQYTQLQLLVDLLTESEPDGCTRNGTICESGPDCCLGNNGDNTDNIECRTSLPVMPKRLSEMGILTSKTLHRLSTKLTRLSTHKSQAAIDLIMKHSYPSDLKIQLVHSGCGDSLQHTSQLHQVLVMCKSAENPVILEFKIHTHLAWCYFGHDMDKFEEHNAAACQLASLIDTENTCLQLLFELQPILLAMKMFKSQAIPPAKKDDQFEYIAKLFHMANRSSIKYNSSLYMIVARLHNLFINLIMAKYYSERRNAEHKALHMGSVKETLMLLYSDTNWRGLEGFANTGWFWKILGCLQLPSRLRDLAKMLQEWQPEDFLNTNSCIFEAIMSPGTCGNGVMRQMTNEYTCSGHEDVEEELGPNFQVEQETPIMKYQQRTMAPHTQSNVVCTPRVERRGNATTNGTSTGCGDSRTTCTSEAVSEDENCIKNSIHTRVSRRIVENSQIFQKDYSGKRLHSPQFSLIFIIFHGISIILLALLVILLYTTRN